MAQLRRGSYHTAPPILALATARASLGADFSAFQGHVRRQPPKTAAGTERARNAARGANPTSHLRDFRWMRTLCLPSARIGPPIPALGTPRASLGAEFPPFQGHEPRQPANTPAGTVRARNRAPGGHCSRQSRAFSHLRGECLPSASNGPPLARRPMRILERREPDRKRVAAAQRMRKPPLPADQRCASTVRSSSSAILPRGWRRRSNLSNHCCQILSPCSAPGTSAFTRRTNSLNLSTRSRVFGSAV